MNFAFILFKHLAFGGMQRNMLSIARECAGRGHRVSLLCTRWQGPRQGEGMELVELPGSRFEKLRSNGAQMRSFHRRCRSWLQSHPQDLVVGFNKFPGLDAYYAADSCFAHKAYGEKGPLYRLTPRARIYLEFERAVFDAAGQTRILEVSPKERAHFQRYYQTPDERFFTLPPGIGRDRMAADNFAALRRQLRDDLQIAEATRVFLTVGSGFRTKGLDRSIQLLADWKAHEAGNAILLVAGADREDAFRQQAQRLGVSDSLRFLGGRDDVPALFQAADVVIHPAYRENTGNVLLEAMIAGRPVIATDVCGYAHYIEEARMGAVLPSPFSSANFLEAVRNCLQVADVEWRRRGAAFAENSDIFSRPLVAADLLESFCWKAAPDTTQGTAMQVPS